MAHVCSSFEFTTSTQLDSVYAWTACEFVVFAFDTTWLRMPLSAMQVIADSVMFAVVDINQSCSYSRWSMCRCYGCSLYIFTNDPGSWRDGNGVVKAHLQIACLVYKHTRPIIRNRSPLDRLLMLTDQTLSSLRTNWMPWTRERK